MGKKGEEGSVVKTSIMIVIGLLVFILLVVGLVYAATDWWIPFLTSKSSVVAPTPTRDPLLVTIATKVDELSKAATCPPTVSPPTPIPTLVLPAPTKVLPTSTPVPSAQPCLFDLRKSIRGLPGATIVDDRSDWDGKANGLVSYVKVECTTAAFHFERWGPPGSWTDLLETKEVAWGAGDYNLQELFYPSGEKDLNDTLQTVLVQPGGTVELREHDKAPWGIKILLSCPDNP